MTTIVAYKTADGVWLAADSRATEKGFVYPTVCRKLRRIDGWGVGLCGGGRLQRALDQVLPDLAEVTDPGAFVDRLHDFCGEKGLTQTDKDDGTRHIDAMLLLTDGEHIWQAGSTGSLLEMRQFFAIGSGVDFALGALCVLCMAGSEQCESVEANAETIVKFAMKVAAEFDSGTGGPIDTMFIERRSNTF